MKATLIIAGLMAALVLAIALKIGVYEDIATFYATSLRGSLFSGFLTLGGFLLSLKTFIVVKMKEGLYDHRLYRAAHADEKQQNPTNAGTLFGRLSKLRTLLFLAIVSALGTAALQITLGLVKNEVTVAFCLAAAGFSLTLLARSLIEINGNLRTWFEYLEQDALDQEDAAKAKATEG